MSCLDRRTFLSKTGKLTSGIFSFPLIPFINVGATRKIKFFGDSILQGYLPYVKSELEGKCSIWASETPHLNSRDLLNLIRSVTDFDKSDIIHLNSGLYDVNTSVGATNELNVSLDEYLNNVNESIKLLHKKNPKIQVIWATTTPVNGEVVFKSGNSGTKLHVKEEDIVRYNDALIELTSRLGVGLNDLHKVIIKSGGERLFSKDGIHMNELGYKYLGDWVTETVKLFF
jgi:lysophospholipase L1-like esterase